MYHVHLIGATGAVGQEILRLLEKGSFPIQHIRLFGSERSLGKKISFKNEEIPIELLDEKSFKGAHFAFFCAGSAISKQHIPLAVRQKVTVIDSSSYYRLDPTVPLVIPEINLEALEYHSGIVSSPNCTASIMLMALAPLHRRFQAKRVVAATYQAASGGGAKLMRELELETAAYLENRPFQRHFFPFPYAFNLFPHNSPLTDSGYCEEEIKMVEETKKILQDDSLRITATCVRVPVFRAHAIALNVQFENDLSVEETYAILQKTKGVTIFEDREKNRFATPFDVSGKEGVFCGRVRKDLSQEKTIDLWVVGDQLLKGAAQNAVQIFEALIHKQPEKSVSDGVVSH